jgi:hypothetical protein
MSTETKNSKPPVMLIEYTDQRDSGWVLDGTRGKPHHTELRAPSKAFIPNTGFRAAFEGEEGRKVKVNKAIRYIKNCPFIDVDEQKKHGFEPHTKQPAVDKIVIDKGYATIVREGDVALYDYLQAVYYNESNEHRTASATALFRVVELDKKAETVNEKDFIVAEAVSYISKNLVLKTGKDTYKYNEAKIDTVCSLLSVYAETPSQKVVAITSFAKVYPEEFLSRIRSLENTTVTDITHALQLNVIKFNENSVVYVNKDKVITSLGSGTMTQAQKVKKLADLLQTPEYNAQYTELRAELEAAKEKDLS